MSLNLLDEHGRAVSLGPKIGEGGEGSVWELAGSTDTVVKVYKGAIAPEKAEKLRVMPSLANADVLKVAAWPTKLLFAAGSRSLSAIAMPRIVNHQEIHQLYSSASRRVHFPEATWDFLIHAAMNCAAAFETVHKAGQVIGDVNQGGVLVSKQGTIRLIDCDSFQVQANGRVFYCEVGVPIFTPPELQGISSFRGIARTPNHDNFGLALLIFHLLFMGRHPFAGRYSGTGDMSIEKAIAESRFAFSSQARSFQMSPPPNALSLNVLLPELGAMFERAFARPTNQALRPTAGDWHRGLLALKSALTKCQNDKAHLFPQHLSECPWCKIEEEGGPAFFVASNVTLEFDAGFDWARVWNDIARAAMPPSSSGLNLPVPTARITPRAIGLELRFDLIDPPSDVGAVPVLSVETMPQIPTYRSLVETIPPDPPFVAMPEPALALPKGPPPPAVPQRPVMPPMPVVHDRQGRIDYLTVAWIACLSLVADVVSVLIHPLVAVIGFLLPATFFVVWAVLHQQRRKARQAQLEKTRRMAESLESQFAVALSQYAFQHRKWESTMAEIRAAWERRSLEVRRQWMETEATRRSDWEQEIRRLAAQRLEAPLKEEEHRRKWEEECERIKRLRAEIELRNRWAQAQWVIEKEQHQQQLRESQVVKERIDRASARFAAEMLDRQNRRDAATKNLDSIQRLWQADGGRFETEWRRIREGLEVGKQEYELLRGDYQAELGRRQANQRQSQFDDFLASCLIDTASIPNIGKARKALLLANSIETAADVNEGQLAALDGQGFGPRLIENLLDWRKDVERKFRFDPSKGMPAAEIRSLQAHYQTRRQAMQRTLRGGRERLDAVRNASLSRLKDLQKLGMEAAVALAQAEADLELGHSVERQAGRR